MLHSFLLVGQSNAAGRGFIKDAAPLDNCGGKLKVLRNGLWVPMYRPVNNDRGFSGTCLAESFAKAYYLDHAEENIQVGIIPCADGGTAIRQWMPGEVLFDNAVNCARLAMRSSKLVGILWHQGEQDCGAGTLDNYAEKFTEVMNAFRRELALPELPIIVGGLSDFLKNFDQSPALRDSYEHFNELLSAAVSDIPNCSFVPTIGLPSNPDYLHFSAAALDELGLLYYEAYKQFGGVQSGTAASVNTERSEMELL